MSPTAALTADSLGAWLLKASPSGGAVDELLRPGSETVTTRCVRPTYRISLVTAGQPVLLWVSGRDERYPAGVHAAGWTTGPVADGRDGPVMPVRLQPLSPPISRVALLGDQILRGLEVLRMPAGSNPSYLDRAQYAALCGAFPQVDRPVRAELGNA
jgi:hypothetical protein